MAQLHGTSVETFLVITLAMLWSLAHFGAPRPVTRRAQVMLGVLAAQAGVGYAQYLNGDPVAVIAVHVAGASLAVVATLWFYMGLWRYPAAGDELPAGVQSAGVQAAGAQAANAPFAVRPAAGRTGP